MRFHRCRLAQSKPAPRPERPCILLSTTLHLANCNTAPSSEQPHTSLSATETLSNVNLQLPDLQPPDQNGMQCWKQFPPMRPGDPAAMNLREESKHTVNMAELVRSNNNNTTKSIVSAGGLRQMMRSSNATKKGLLLFDFACHP